MFGRSRSIVVAVLVLAATGCGGGADSGPAAETAASTSTLAPATTTSVSRPASSTTSTTASSTTSVPSTTTTQAPPTAEELYQTHCATCHGVELEGGVGPALGAGGHAHGHSEAELTDWITNGKGTMPAFGEKLSSEQIEAVLAFVLAADSAG